MNPRTALQLVSIAANGADANAHGLGYIGAPTIGSYTPAGTVIEWGGNPYFESTNFPLSLSDMQTIAGSLLSTGLYQSVTAKKLAGIISPYYTLRLVTSVDRGALVDVFTDIEDAFSIMGALHETQQFYTVSVPPSSRPGTVTPNTGAPPGTGRSSDGAQSGECPHPKSVLCNCGEEWSMLKLACVPIGMPSDGKNIFDSLAEWLGITPTQAVIVGALGAVVAVVAVKRAL